MKYIITASALFFTLTLFTGCSSEEREAMTDKEAQRQVDHIKQPIEKAKDAAKMLDQHYKEQQLPN